VAKTQAVTALVPTDYGFGRKIIGAADAGVRTLSRLLNWVGGLRPECHLSLAAGPDGWDASGEAVGTLALTATSSSKTPVVTDLWVNRDAAKHTALAAAEVRVLTADTVTITWSLTGGVGTVTHSTTHTSAHNGSERTVAFDLSAVTAGDEWVTCEISIQTTTGSGAHAVLELNFEEDERTAGLPDPASS